MTGSGWRRLLLAGVVVLVVVAAVVWWAVLPHWRPPLGPGERYGVDVSHHQEAVDWRAVAGDGISFAYVKSTEGGDWRDERFAENWSGAARAGLDRGAYHFFTLCRSGAEQARWFLEVAAPEAGAMPPAVDLELLGNCSARPPAADLYRELGDFLRLVDEAWGEETVLYVGDDFEAVYPVRERLGRRLWEQEFPSRPDSPGWWIWQLHGFARVDGVEGRVDLNIMRPGTGGDS